MSDIAEGFIKHTEQTFGAAHPTREKVKNARRIVVKVGLCQHLSALRVSAHICTPTSLQMLCRLARQLLLVARIRG